MKYTKIAFSFLVAAAIIAIAPSSAFALETANTGSTVGTVATQDTGSTVGNTSAPATESTGSTVGTTQTLSTQSTGSTVGTVTTPGTANTGSTVGGTITAPGTANTGSTVGTITVPGTANTGSTVGTITPPGTANTGSTVGGPATPSTPPTSNGNTSSGSSSSSSSSSSGAGSLPPLTSTSQCAYLGSYIQTGKVNNVADIIKLQAFLKNTEGMNVAQTGLYDAQTIAAVNAFQVKYTADVLTPWGVSTPTSQVYYTTSKKINEIFCKTTFALTPAQLAEITRYRTNLQNGTSLSGVVGSNDGTQIENPTGSSTNPSASTTENNQVGAAAKAPILTRIWNFIKRIFGR